MIIEVDTITWTIWLTQYIISATVSSKMQNIAFFFFSQYSSMSISITFILMTLLFKQILWRYFSYRELLSWSAYEWSGLAQIHSLNLSFSLNNSSFLMSFRTFSSENVLNTHNCCTLSNQIIAFRVDSSSIHSSSIQAWCFLFCCFFKFLNMTVTNVLTTTWYLTDNEHWMTQWVLNDVFIRELSKKVDCVVHLSQRTSRILISSFTCSVIFSWSVIFLSTICL